MEQRISGISGFPAKGQPREVDRNFRNELRKSFCSIRFRPGISGNLGRMERAQRLPELYPFKNASKNEKQRITKDRASSVFLMTILRHNTTFQFKNMFQQNLQFNKVQSRIYSVHKMLIDYRHFQAFSVQFQTCEA